jgi:hypothetical protein
MPLFHAHAVSAVGRSGVIHICALHFKKTDPFGIDGNPAPGKLPPCPICQGLHFLNGGLMPPGVIAVVPAFFAGTIIRHFADQAASPMRAASIAWPRAPPVSA